MIITALILLKWVRCRKRPVLISGFDEGSDDNWLEHALCFDTTPIWCGDRGNSKVLLIPPAICLLAASQRLSTLVNMSNALYIYSSI